MLSFSIVCFILLMTTAALLYVYLSATNKYWGKMGVPHPEPELFFGNTRRMALIKENMADTMQTLYNQLEGHRFGGFYMLMTPCLLVRDPELINRILIKDFLHFHDRMNFPHFKADYMAHHVFTMGGALWKEMRQRISYVYSVGQTRRVFFLVQECCARLQNSVQAALNDQRYRDFELKDLLSSFTTDVIGMCSLGIECGAIDDPDSQFRKISKKFFHSSTIGAIRQIWIQMMPTLATILGMKFFSPTVGEFFDRIVMESITYREKNGISRDDLINLMITLKKDGFLIMESGEKIEITDKFLVGQTLVTFGLGFEMTSTTMSFCLFELALNPDVQVKARMEVDAVLRRHGGEMTYEAVQDMEYLEAVVTETLRLYPPQGYLMRQCTEPYQIPGSSFVVQRGMVVYVPLLGLQRDPRIYEDPLRFNPERFRRGQHCDVNCSAVGFMPFGLGPRSCLGQKFALVEVKAGLAALLSRFEFQRCPRSCGRPAPFDPCKILTAAADGLWVRASPRSWLPLG